MASAGNKEEPSCLGWTRTRNRSTRIQAHGGRLAYCDLFMSCYRTPVVQIAKSMELLIDQAKRLYKESKPMPVTAFSRDSAIHCLDLTSSDIRTVQRHATSR